MKRQFPTPLCGILLACAVVLPLTGCSSKKDKDKIEALNREAQRRQDDLDSLGARCEELEHTKSELTTKASEAENNAGTLQNQLDKVKAELEALRGAKSAEAAQTRAQSPAKVLENSKAQVAKQLAAVVMVEGDVTSGRGTVVQADAKTWLYTSPQVLSGNSKVSIKSADGTAVSKFGALQFAPDANLVRLEITQEMPVKFEVDTAATVEATTPLTAVSATPATAGAAGTEPQANECHATRTVGNVFEIESYALQQSGGCPVLGGESGKVIAIIVAADAPPTLWPTTQPAYGSDQNIRAARLNRTIDWKTTTLPAFLGERHKIEDINRTTRLLYALAAVKINGEALQLEGPLGGAGGGSSVGGATTSVLKVLEQNAALPMVTELMKLKTDLANKKVHSSARDINRHVSSILGQAKSASTRQIQDLKSLVFSSCHRPAAELALKWRGEADQALNTAIDAIK